MNSKRTILAFPRSGTKLLSKVHQQNGFYYFGPVFDTFSSQILEKNNNFRAIPKDIKIQRNEITARLHTDGIEEDNKKRAEESWNRLQRWLPYKNLSPSILTIYPDNLTYLPNLLDQIGERLIIIPIRENYHDLIMSNLITSRNRNFYEEEESKPVYASREAVEWQLAQYGKFLKLRKNVLESYPSIQISFNDLIEGKADLDFKYEVTTTDQHKDLRKYIKNYEWVHNFISTNFSASDI